jgi:hypothetical protein
MHLVKFPICVRHTRISCVRLSAFRAPKKYRVDYVSRIAIRLRRETTGSANRLQADDEKSRAHAIVFWSRLHGVVDVVFGSIWGSYASGWRSGLNQSV